MEDSIILVCNYGLIGLTLTGRNKLSLQKCQSTNVERIGSTVELLLYACVATLVNCEVYSAFYNWSKSKAISDTSISKNRW